MKLRPYLKAAGILVLLCLLPGLENGAWSRGEAVSMVTSSAFQQPGDISGVWNSSIGLVYDITVSGNTFTWKERKTGQVANGQISGLSVSASWKGLLRQDSAKGTVTLDALGRAVKIAWSNGVIFTRPPGYFQTAQGVSISGNWRSNFSQNYMITQQGNSFAWTVGDHDQIGNGEISGDTVKASWSGSRGKGAATGKIMKDAAGNPVRIEWSNGVIFNRSGAAQPPQKPPAKTPQKAPAQPPLKPPAKADIGFETVTLNKTTATRITQTAGITGAQQLIQQARTPSGLASLSSQAGISQEKILFLANEMELRGVLGDVTQGEMELLKELGLETVRNLAEFENRSDVLHRFLTGVAQEQNVPPPGQPRVASWVNNATAAVGGSLPPAEQLLQESALPMMTVEAVKFADAVQSQTGRLLTITTPKQPFYATVLKPGEAPGSFVINTGTLEHMTEFEATKPGLYCAKIDLDCDLKLGWVEVRSFVDQPELKLTLNRREQTVVGNVPRSILAQQEFELDDTGASIVGYRPLISSDTSLGQDETSYFTFFLHKKDIPLNGRLRFRLRVVRVKTPGGEVGVEDFTGPPSSPEKHPPIKGVLDVSFVEPFELTSFSGTTQIPSGAEVESPLVVVETPIFQKPAKKEGYLPNYLTFMISHAPKISSQISNEEIYKILGGKHPIASEKPLPVLRDQTIVSGVAVHTDYLDGKYAMDLPSPAEFYGVEVIDIKDPETGIYQMVMSPDPTVNGIPWVSQLATTGWVFPRWDPQTISHELHTTTRELQTYDRYVVELLALEVSTQSEPGDDGNDDGYGEFKISTTAMLSNRKPLNELEGGFGVDKTGLPQYFTFTRTFPVTSEHGRPEYMHIRTESDFNRHVCFPQMPIVDFSDDWLIQPYKDLAVNVSVIEDDKHTWWQENSVLFKRFFNFCKAIAEAYSNPSSLLGNIQSKILPMFDSSLGLDEADDKIGSPGMVTSVESKWGLWEDREYDFTTAGPRDSQYFRNSTEPPSGDIIRANITLTDQQPHAKAYFRVKRFPRYFSWADIQLVGFTLREGTDGNEPTNLYIRFGLPEYRIVPGIYPVHWEPTSNWKTLYFNASPGQYIKVRDPAPPKAVKSQLGDWLVPDESASLDAGVLETDTKWEMMEGFEPVVHENPLWRGYTYFQSTFWDDDPGSDTFLGVASYTLYHDDVLRFAGQGPQLLDHDRVLFRSYKPAGSPFHVVEITVDDPGTWMKSVEYVAYVYIGN